MKKLLLVAFTAMYFMHSNGQAGNLDTGFGSQGIVTPNYPGYTFSLGSVVIQPDGKLVTAGRASGGGNDFMAVLRYNSNGTPDNTFSEDGLALIDFGNNDFAADVALQADGKIVVVGRCNNNNNNDFAVARLNADGTLDNSFSGDGKVQTDFSNSNDAALKVAIQTDGKIVVFGSSLFQVMGPGGMGYAVARYNSDGSLDPNFSGDGTSRTVFSPNDAPKSFAIQPDGKLIMCGTWYFGNLSGITDFLVARLNSDGTKDFSFNGNGYATVGFSTYLNTIDEPNDMVLQSDGKILVAGTSYYSSGGGFGSLARLNSYGTLDNTFSDDGKLSMNPFAGFNAIVMQSNGKIIASGYSYSGNIITRLYPDGSPDSTFSEDGIVFSNFGVSDLAVSNDRLFAVCSPSSIAAYFLENQSGVFGCPPNRTVNTDPGMCTALVNYLEPSGVPSDASLSYTLAGATTGSGTGSASGRTFNKGVTTITYNTTNPSATCQFTVTVNDKELPTVEYPIVQQFCYSESMSIPPLQVTDNCGIESITYSISGATTNSGTGTNISGHFNWGDNYVTWTIQDLSGNIILYRAIIKIYQPLSLDIPDAVASNSGVDLNTVYIGYVPAAKLTLDVFASGGINPYYTYKWSNGETMSTITVSPALPTTYYVTVKDEAGCSSTASKFVNVVDVRCGNKLDKVLVCQVPKGNPSNAHPICISSDAVPAHLKNGGYLGECKTNLTTASRATEVISEEAGTPKLAAYPNPSSKSFTLVFKSAEKLQGELIVWDDLGKVIEKRLVMPNSTIQIGDAYRPGVYVVQMRQGAALLRVKLIKTSR